MRPWGTLGASSGRSYFLSYPPPKDLNPNTPEPLAKIVYRALTVPEYGLPELERDLVDFLRKE